MKIINLSLSVLLLYGCTTPRSVSQITDNKRIENATIVIVDRPSFYSGYVKTWVKVVASVEGQKSIIVYLPYMSGEQIFPPVGSLCSMATHKAYLVGISVDGSLDENKPLRVSTLMECDKIVYRY